jgi:hypothetical protein
MSLKGAIARNSRTPAGVDSLSENSGKGARSMRRLLIVLTTCAAVPLAATAAYASGSLQMGPTARFGLDPSYVIAKATYTCPKNTAEAFLSAEVTQVRRGRVIDGSGYVDTVTCDGTPHTYRIQVRSFDRIFRKGRATGRAFASACTAKGVCTNSEAGPRLITVS